MQAVSGVDCTESGMKEEDEMLYYLSTCSFLIKKEVSKILEGCSITYLCFRDQKFDRNILRLILDHGLRRFQFLVTWMAWWVAEFTAVGLCGGFCSNHSELGNRVNRI